MRISILATIILVSGCTMVTGGAPEVTDLNNGTYYISARTGTAPFEQPKKAARKFAKKASELCLGKEYTESEIHEWSMESPNTGTGFYTVTIKVGVIKCN